MTDLASFFDPELKAWQGRAPLWRVFWLHGVGVSACLLAVILFALHDGRFLQLQIALIAFLAYTAWLLVAVWRCTRNAAPFWGDFARVLTVSWAANACALSIFLEIELLAGLL
ncbi:hypothetical protein [Lutibaculum baratangense]|uniref:Transmembrane protein n=1 Tax=Lutibaculum baratangense AMV1 TaxID=631454 RepID=V4RJL3_9HYPH|nr:hypothetical protein [Lutibaculum baratangense]ESR23425.1 hypothetical protein N177_3493 [Lutibaculum baratangense AMV1]